MKRFMILSLMILTTIPVSADEHKDKKEYRKRDGHGIPFLRFSFGSRHHHKPAVFDIREIFALSINDFSNNIKEHKKNFAEESRLITEEIKYCEKKMVLLLDAYKNGMDKTEDIQQVAIRLQELSLKYYNLLHNHSKKIMEHIEQNFKESDQQMQQQLQNSNELVPIILKRYDNFLENNL